MSLTKDQKEALNAHYHGKDLYDPSIETDQDPPTFMPDKMSHEKGLCSGGPAGYSEGGPVKMWDAGVVPGNDPNGGLAQDSGTADADPSAYITNDQQKQQAQANLAKSIKMKDAVAATQTPPIATRMPATPPQAGPGPMEPEEEDAANASLEQPDAAPAPGSKLDPNQYAQLVQALTQRPSLGQSVASGVGALADGIMQGVARAGNPGFQKNITEQQQLQKQNLIAALEAKFKGQGLGLENQRVGIEQQRANNELANAAAERGVQERGQDITAKTAASERGVQTANQTREASQAQRDADLKIVQEYSPLKPGGYTKAQYEAASARLKANGAQAPGAKRTTPNGVTYSVNQ